MNTIAGASQLAMNGQRLLAYIDFGVGRHRLGDNWLSVPSFSSESSRLLSVAR